MLAPRAVSKAALLLAFNPFSCLEFLIQWFPTSSESSETVIGKQASRRHAYFYFICMEIFVSMKISDMQISSSFLRL